MTSDFLCQVSSTFGSVAVCDLPELDTSETRFDTMGECHQVGVTERELCFNGLSGVRSAKREPITPMC